MQEAVSFAENAVITEKHFSKRRNDVNSVIRYKIQQIFLLLKGEKNNRNSK